jgi:hypothetical protein
MVDISFSIPRQFLSNLNHSEETKRIFYNFMNEILEKISSIHNSKHLKKIIYHTPNMMKNTDCAICLDPIRLYSPVHILPCKHGFHIECIKSLTENHYYSCPMCRTPL